jgi:hypothetical protein
MTRSQKAELGPSEVGDQSWTGTIKSWVHVELAEIGSGSVVRAEGWVFSDSDEQICEVRAVSLGKIWPATYPIPRPDVAAAFPSAAGAGMSGFAVQISAEPGSSFKLMLEANLPASGWKVFYQGKVAIPPVGLWLRGKRPLTEAPHPGFLLWFDEPLDWNKLPRRFRFSGWCFSKSGEPITALRARIGRREYPGSYGIFRADVAALHQERRGTFKSGFQIIAQAPRGPAIVTLEARLANGSWCEVFAKRISAPLLNLRPVADPQLWEIGDYATWIKRYDTLRRADRREIRAHIERLRAHPLISIVMPVYNSTAAHLRCAIDSVRAQLYSNWELCMVDDASTAKHVRRILGRYAKLDRRIKVRFRERNDGIAAASNDALALTSGDFVALLDDDDELAPAALYHVACEINAHPDAQLFYSDEDKLDTTGRRCNVHFKPDWN